jgi:hypothetical protein
MIKLFTALFFISTSTAILHAQQLTAILQGGNFDARVNHDGVLFNRKDISWPGYEYPSWSDSHTIYASNFWMGGLVTDQSLRLAAATYADPENDYAYGPVANDYTSDEYVYKYNRLWYATRHSIDLHIQNYANEDYVMPVFITTWPANGNTANGEAADLAPYVDANENGYYDPENGDYPEILGDVAVYYILNDTKQIHEVTGTPAIGVELHVMVYAFWHGQSPLNSACFVRVKAHNRSFSNLSNFYFGVWNDFDLGHYNDDYVGTDVERNMTYVYNAIPVDQPFLGPQSYGTRIPTQGCMLLNGNISSSVSYENHNGLNGIPTMAEHFYNYLRGIWKNNSAITVGGIGTTGSIPTSIMYPGYPETDEGWNEYTVGNEPGDRKMLMSVGPLLFEANSSQCFDFAYISYWSNDGTHISRIEDLREFADYIQNFYDNELNHCSIVYSTVDEAQRKAETLTVYPNPASDHVFIQSTEQMREILIYDVRGQLVVSEHLRSTSWQRNLSELSTGIYVYKVSFHSGNAQHGKLIIQ